MKKGLLSLLLIVVTIVCVSAKKSADPVLMTIDKKPVHLSEFEYLYQKNNAQQTTVQPVDEYLQMFINYKLKVAAAEDAGLDQTPEFQTEFEGYSRDLSEPYLIDNDAREQLLHSIYDRLKEEVKVCHIMSPNREQLDSVRREILAGRLSFDDAAANFSIDGGSAYEGGSMGYITAGRYPYTFEDAAYSTPVGSISEVIATPFGYHIVKVDDRRPAQGSVKVQHILKLTRGMSPEAAATAKAQIDSLYNVLISGQADFFEVARDNSDDRASAQQGGLIDWFTTGQMVPEFEAVSFSLNPGETSQPFETAYGYHIVRTLEKRGLQPYEELEEGIANMIARDDRQYIPIRSKTRSLREQYHTTINEKTAAEIRTAIAEHRADSTYIADRMTDNRVIINVNGDQATATVADVFSTFANELRQVPTAQALGAFDRTLESLADNTTLEYERARLVNENADFRNLLNEYRDGMLLFEISDRNVWSKAKDDREGLEKFFRENRDKYATWTAPKFKGYIVFSTSDSILTAAQNYLANNTVEAANLAETLRQQFGRDIKVERVLAAQGENAITDFLGFGGERPAAVSRWAYYFPYAYKIADQPEEAADARGAVTADYQAYLEQQWLDSLRRSHKVKINNKIFNSYKASLEQ